MFCDSLPQQDLGKTQVDGHVAVIVPAMSAYVFAPESR